MHALEKSRRLLSCVPWPKEKPKVTGVLTPGTPFFLSVLAVPASLQSLLSCLPALLVIQHLCCPAAPAVAHPSSYLSSCPPGPCVLQKALWSGDTIGAGSLKGLLMDCWQTGWTGGQSEPPLPWLTSDLPWSNWCSSPHVGTLYQGRQSQPAGTSPPPLPALLGDRSPVQRGSCHLCGHLRQWDSFSVACGQWFWKWFVQWPEEVSLRGD